MSTTSTPNLGLVKPTLGTGEHADVSVINGNMDKIDEAVGAVNPSQDGSLASQVSALNSATAITVTATPGANVILRTCSAYRVGKLVCLSLQFDLNGSFANGATLLTLSGLPAPAIQLFEFAANSTTYAPVSLKTSGGVSANGAFTANQGWMAVSFTYITS